MTVVEREKVAGPGLAYRTKQPLHMLNNDACRMSALEDDPDRTGLEPATQRMVG